MTNEPARTWDYGNIRFYFSQQGEKMWILGARRVDDGVRLHGQVALGHGDYSEDELLMFWTHRLSNAVNENPVTCHACQAVLRQDQADTRYQFENAMWVSFKGGYGMFVETPDFGGPGEVVICHDCAHELCDKIPWISALIDPYNSHSHHEEWKQAHPDHYGWDYDPERF